jgi:hypothetical protein
MARFQDEIDAQIELGNRYVDPDLVWRRISTEFRNKQSGKKVNIDLGGLGGEKPTLK